VACIPLLGNDREINKSTTVVTRQLPVNSNRGTVFSVRSVPRYYKQGQLAVGVDLVSQITAEVPSL
jgi:hypothetical protein